LKFEVSAEFILGEYLNTNKNPKKIIVRKSIIIFVLLKIILTCDY